MSANAVVSGTPCVWAYNHVVQGAFGSHIALDAIGDDHEHVVGNAQRLAPDFVCKIATRVQIRHDDVSQQPALKTTPQPILQAGAIRWRQSLVNTNCLPGRMEVIEGVKETSCVLSLADDELNIIDEQHVDR